MFAMIPSYMSDLHQDFCHVTHGRGRSSVLLWRRSDMLCTSGFIDDVIFAHKPGSLDLAAQLKLGWAGLSAVRSITTTDARTTFRALKVTSQVAPTGAKSALFKK